jgi:hypothetical protein
MLVINEKEIQPVAGFDTRLNNRNFAIMKSVSSSNELDNIKLARFCAALGNPTLVGLLKEVAQAGTCVKDDVVRFRGLSKFTVVRNLIYLKKFELVKGNLNTKNLTYCIDYDKMAEFKTLFDSFYSQITENRNMKEDSISCNNK